MGSVLSETTRALSAGLGKEIEGKARRSQLLRPARVFPFRLSAGRPARMCDRQRQRKFQSLCANPTYLSIVLLELHVSHMLPAKRRLTTICLSRRIGTSRYLDHATCSHRRRNEIECEGAVATVDFRSRALPPPPRIPRTHDVTGMPARAQPAFKLNRGAWKTRLNPGWLALFLLADGYLSFPSNFRGSSHSAAAATYSENASPADPSRSNAIPRSRPALCFEVVVVLSR